MTYKSLFFMDELSRLKLTGRDVSKLLVMLQVPTRKQWNLKLKHSAEYIDADGVTTTFPVGTEIHVTYKKEAITKAVQEDSIEVLLYCFVITAAVPQQLLLTHNP